MLFKLCICALWVYSYEEKASTNYAREELEKEASQLSGIFREGLSVC